MVHVIADRFAPGRSTFCRRRRRSHVMQRPGQSARPAEWRLQGRDPKTRSAFHKGASTARSWSGSGRGQQGLVHLLRIGAPPHAEHQQKQLCQQDGLAPKLPIVKRNMVRLAPSCCDWPAACSSPSTCPLCVRITELQGFRGAIPEHRGPQRHVIHSSRNCARPQIFPPCPTRCARLWRQWCCLGYHSTLKGVRSGWDGCWLRRGTG